MLLEKRQFERREYRVRFRCYMEGGARYPALSLDLGKGGAFLTSTELPVPGSLIVVEAVDSNKNPLPVLLVGRVVRTEQGDRIGVGVQWVKAVIRKEIGTLVRFLTHFFGLEDLHPPALTDEELADDATKIIYDFRRASFSIRQHRSPSPVRPDWSLVVDSDQPLPPLMEGDPMFQYTSSMSTDLEIEFPDDIADAPPPRPPPEPRAPTHEDSQPHEIPDAFGAEAPPTGESGADAPPTAAPDFPSEIELSPISGVHFVDDEKDRSD